VLQKHGPEVLLRAVDAGLQEQIFSADYVERFVERSLAFQEVLALEENQNGRC
jgi:hypothetical protein